MARTPFWNPCSAPVERLTYRLLRVDARREQTWKGYTVAMLLFSFVTMVFTYAVLRFQDHLPFHGIIDGLPNKTAMTPDLAFNTAASFTTNTNWQAYSGENTMSYFSQMVGLASHNFWSAAVGHRHRGGPGARHRPSRVEERSATSGSIWFASITICCCRSASCTPCS